MSIFVSAKYFFLILAILLILIVVVYLKNKTRADSMISPFIPQVMKNVTNNVVINPLSITYMKSQKYPGSDFVIEQTLSDGSNYHQYIASYLSENLKINGLLTVPKGTPPSGGWPAILFNHGYIQPDLYQTTSKYVAYVEGFAKSGYVVFKPDLRGHGKSEGIPEGAYYSPAYTIDDLNALSSLKRYPQVNPQKLGVWGHSMGGNITLRDLVVNPEDIKVAVIWGGVVGSYDDLMNNWTRKVPFVPSQRDLALRINHRKELIDKYGTPTSNPVFWNSIDPTAHLDLINAPIFLVVGGNDEEVPIDFSIGLRDKLLKLNKPIEFLKLPGGDHNISGNNFAPAMKASVDFFDRYLK